MSLLDIPSDRGRHDGLARSHHSIQSGLACKRADNSDADFDTDWDDDSNESEEPDDLPPDEPLEIREPDEFGEEFDAEEAEPEPGDFWLEPDDFDPRDV